MASKTRVDILEINLREPHLFIHYIGVSMNYVFVQNININICFFYEVKDSQNRLINTTTQSIAPQTFFRVAMPSSGIVRFLSSP